MPIEDDDFAQVPLGQSIQIWLAFDSYVKDLIKANPDMMEEQWFLRWKKLQPILLDESTHPQTSLLVITNKPGSTLVAAVFELLRLIPFLVHDVVVKYEERNENVVAFYIKAFDPKPLPTSAMEESENIEENDDDDDNDEDDDTEVEDGDSQGRILTQDNINEQNDDKEINESDISFANSVNDKVTAELHSMLTTYNIDNMMKTPKLIKDEYERIDEFVTKYRARIDIIKKAVIDTTKSELNNHKEAILKEIRNDARKERHNMENEVAQAFEDRIATCRKEFSEIVQSMAAKQEEAKRHMCDLADDILKKRREIEKLREEVNSTKQQVQSPKAKSTVPIRNPPRSVGSVVNPYFGSTSPASRIRGGNGNDTTRSPLSNANASHNNDDMKRVNEKYVDFEQPGGMYTLRDHEFKRNCPMLQVCKKKSDIVNIYNFLQTTASSYNIMITPFTDVKVWDKAPDSIPTTCNMYYDEFDPITVMVYQRMSSAIYEKLKKTSFLYVAKYKKIMDSRITDGFSLLYRLIESEHPKLSADVRRPAKPTIDGCDCIFDMITEYESWLDYEKISNRTYTASEQLEYILEQLKGNDKYSDAHQLLDSQYMMYKQDVRRDANAPFPTGLLLLNLDSTIATVYDSDDQSDLYGPVMNDGRNTGNATGAAQINALRGQPNMKPQNQAFYGRLYQAAEKKNWRRPVIGTFCKCCGTYGHDVYRNGCDFAAKLVQVDEFLTKNPHMTTQLLEKFKESQKKHGANRTGRSYKGAIAQKMRDNAGRRNVPLNGTIRALFDVVGDALEDEIGVQQEEEDETAVVNRVEDELAQLERNETQEEDFHDSKQQE